MPGATDRTAGCGSTQERVDVSSQTVGDPLEPMD